MNGLQTPSKRIRHPARWTGARFLLGIRAGDARRSPKVRGMVSYSSSPPRCGGKPLRPPLRAKTAPCSLVIRRGGSRTPGKLLSGLSLMAFFEGSVCSPLCSTTRFFGLDGWG
jgi:hypothetical protein